MPAATHPSPRPSSSNGDPLAAITGAFPKGAPEVPAGLTRNAARRLAWQRGRLRWKLDENQKAIYDLLATSKFGRFYLNCGRRVGKSFLLCVLALEKCFSTPGAVVKYVAPTAKLIRQNIRPIIQAILEDCPNSLRPKWNNMDSEYRFPNGSVLTVNGCEDGSEENLRGSKADLVLIDECGFIKNLQYVMRSILGPMLLTTGGPMILASTPPVSPAHYSVEVFRTLDARGQAVTRTIYDNPRLTQAAIDRFLEDERGTLTLEQFKKSVPFRREYLAEFIVDSTRQVIPEWDDQKRRECVREVERPEFCDRYVGLDVGFRDGMASVYAYWDFLNARLVVEDELLLFKQTIRATAEEIRKKELLLWQKPDGSPLAPYLRVADNDLLTLAELGEHGLTFIPTAKDNKELAVNGLRQLVAAGKVVVHPRCQNLVKQLYTTVWNEARSSFERNQDGHGDLLDALIYLCRNVRRERNPYPANWGQAGATAQTVYFPRSTSRTPTQATVLHLFKRRVS